MTLASLNTKVSFFRGITFKVILGLLVLDMALVSGIVVVMNTIGADLVKKESSKLIEETGNGVVTELVARLEKIEALTRGLANAGESFIGTNDEALLHRTIINMLNFDDDFDVAGGGIWYEPEMMDPQRVRKCYFWGRDEQNHLVAYDDYNRAGLVYNEDRFDDDPAYRGAFLASPGYHNEAWYVVARHLPKSGRGFWSRAYMDPYSKQPMVTVTVAMRDPAGKFLGVATADLKLEGLHELAGRWAQKTGGYLFFLDRNNEFITFPKPALVKIDHAGKQSDLFTDAANFATKAPAFAHVAHALNNLQEDLLKRAADMPHYMGTLVAAVDAASYQIDADEAALIAAIVADPLNRQTRLLRRLSVSEEVLLGQPSVVSIFHVPHAYWKAVVVKPASDYVAVANQIRNKLLGAILVIIVGVFVMACSYQLLMVVRPIKVITEKVANIALELHKGKAIADIEDRDIFLRQRGEIGRLARIFNAMTQEVEHAQNISQNYSRMLQEKVEERTRELKASQEIALQNAHAAGMAEISTGILHNIGNVVNSLNISVEELGRGLEGDHLYGYQRAVHMLRLNEDRLDQFFAADEKGPMLVQYLIQFSEVFEKKHLSLERVVTEIKEEIDVIRNVILTQQSYAEGRDFYENVDLFKVTDDALRLEARALKERGIRIVRNYQIVPRLHVSKTKVMHILINLIKNARESIALGSGAKELTITISCLDRTAQISISDSGLGIEEEDLNRIFVHGFTTKKGGNGFGLHYCANAAVEMGGRLTAESEGPGRGATFTLYFAPFSGEEPTVSEELDLVEIMDDSDDYQD